MRGAVGGGVEDPVPVPRELGAGLAVGLRVRVGIGHGKVILGERCEGQQAHVLDHGKAVGEVQSELACPGHRRLQRPGVVPVDGLECGRALGEVAVGFLDVLCYDQPFASAAGIGRGIGGEHAVERLDLQVGARAGGAKAVLHRDVHIPFRGQLAKGLDGEPGAVHGAIHAINGDHLGQVHVVGVRHVGLVTQRDHAADAAVDQQAAHTVRYTVGFQDRAFDLGYP